MRSKTRAPERRAYHSALVVDKVLYILGGEDSHEGFRSSMFSMDLRFLGHSSGKLGDQKFDSEWLPVVPDYRYKYAPGGISHHSCIVYNGFAFLYGGMYQSGESNQILFKFEFATDKWTHAKQYGDLPGPRDSHTAVLYEDSMFIFGGFTEQGVKTNLVHRYDLNTHMWTLVKSS